MQENINLKLNIVLPGLGDSGGIQVVKKYKELLKEQGWDVVIYAPVKAYNLHRYKSEAKNIVHQIYCTLKTISEMKGKPEYKWIWKVSNRTIRDADIAMATLWAIAFDVNKLDASKGKKWHFIRIVKDWLPCIFARRKITAADGLQECSLRLNMIMIAAVIYIRVGIGKKLKFVSTLYMKVDAGCM